MTKFADIHETISSLNRQAAALAPKVAEETLNSCATNEVPTGPRQRRAFLLVALGYVLNSLSDLDWTYTYTNTDDALATYIPRDLITEYHRAIFTSWAGLRAKEVEEIKVAQWNRETVKLTIPTSDGGYEAYGSARDVSNWLAELPTNVEISIDIEGNRAPERLMARDIPRPGRRFTSLTHGTEWFLSTGPYPFFGEHARVLSVSVTNVERYDADDLRYLFSHPEATR